MRINLLEIVMKIIFQILGLVLVSGLALVFIVLTLGPIFLDLNKGKTAKKEHEEK